LETKVAFQRSLRLLSTDAESKLWYWLRDRRLGGFKFRRQYPIGRYIVDFCCYEQRLIVELDGAPHLSSRLYDAERTQNLEKFGFRVLRFWNSEVLGHVHVVSNKILHVLEESKKKEPI
jgi:very-short-patch-repair endonuclease